MRNTFSAQYFNPRSHEGSDTRICSPVALPWLFQSTLPRGERPYFVFLRYPLELFQSTLPRGERRRIASAPASPPANFNPRSHEGSDSPSTRLSASRKNFNPRSHEGSDHPDSSPGRVWYISIHAPTRGATSLILRLCPGLLFQSTLPRGERPQPVAKSVPWLSFQSTLPRGERRTRNVTIHLQITFQSTLPRGERLKSMALNLME